MSNEVQSPSNKEGDKPPLMEDRTKRCYNGYSEFNDLLISAGPCRVALFTHRCPDPDAIASMMGMQWLLMNKFGLDSDFFYDGEVSHPQNGAMVNLLDPGLKRVSEDYREDLYKIRILVDTIPENAGIGNHKVVFDACIDHHRDLPHNFTGVMVHKKCGSCAGIIYDMMGHFVADDNWLNEDLDTDVKVATALIAGIVTDTEYLMSDDTTDLEFKAFSELFPFRNSVTLKKIIFFKRPKFWIDKKAEGCSGAELTDEGYAIVGLGVIPEKQRDLIADMAEEMVTWSSVETAIAFAVVGGERIEASVRSLNPSLTVSEFCRKLGGKHGSGGGKHGKGAYRLPLAGLSIDQDEEEVDVTEAWESLRKRETKRILRLIKK